MCSKVAGLFACFFPSSGIYCRIFSSFQGNRYLLKYENEVEGIFSYILLNDRKKSYMVTMCILQKLEMTQTVITNFTLMDESLPLTSVKHIILEFRN